MHPDLISVGPLTIRSYGTMIVMGFLFALALARVRIRKCPVSFETILDLSFYLLLAGIVGGKLLFWIIFPGQLVYEVRLLFADPFEFLKSLGAGFVFFGAVIGGIGFLLLYSWKKQMAVLPVIDFLTPSLIVGHAFGRVGCFLAGCCYGKTCDLPWSVTFHHPHSLAPQDIPLHPVQIYESLFLFALVSVILLLEDRLTRIPGRLFFGYVISYSTWRFYIEFLRDDPRGILFNGIMTVTQFIAILGFLASVVAFFMIARSGKPGRKKRENGTGKRS
ncbi:prolipoprotein diacylglyceryl transferase [bacterium]|nr:prolipoprotein diacylglyceryl transferase [candidate division CSSED10-310 bacterium]